MFSRITFLPIKSEMYFIFDSHNCAKPDVSWQTACTNTNFHVSVLHWAALPVSPKYVHVAMIES